MRGQDAKTNARKIKGGNTKDAEERGEHKDALIIVLAKDLTGLEDLSGLYFARRPKP